jgi:hypothetical protein
VHVFSPLGRFARPGGESADVAGFAFVIPALREEA